MSRLHALRAEWGTLVPKLHIAVSLDASPHVIVMSQMVAIPSSQLGAVVGDASPWRGDIVAAVYLLVSGF
jgi:toxin CcdB